MHHSAIFSAISMQFSRISQRSLAISQQCEVQENLSAVRFLSLFNPLTLFE